MKWKQVIELLNSANSCLTTAALNSALIMFSVICVDGKKFIIFPQANTIILMGKLKKKTDTKQKLKLTVNNKKQRN